MKKNKVDSNVVYLPCPGYIYLVNVVGTNNFKIGLSKESVIRRITELQTACPFRLRYVYHSYVRDVQRTEKELHQVFNAFRRIGEWFSLNEDSVKECITLMRLIQIQEPITLLKESKSKEESNLTNSLFTDVDLDLKNPDSILDTSKIASQETKQVSDEVVKYIWTVQGFKQMYPDVTPEQLFQSVSYTAISGESVRNIIRNVLKCRDGNEHPTRSYSIHGKTLLTWLITNYDFTNEVSQQSKIQSFLQNKEKE